MIHFFVKKVNIKLIKRTVADWLKIIIFLLDDAVALFLIILLLRFIRMQIPLPAVILLAILVSAFVFEGQANDYQSISFAASGG